MNRQGSIDGILEAWFLDGPNEMPDRVFQAVFDQVERAPQRRLARIYLRLSDMNRQTRVFAVLATALIAVFVLAIAFNRDPNANVGTSPIPSNSPGASADSVPPSPGAALPVAIQGRWMGGTPPPASPLSASRSGSSLLLSADRVAVTPSNDGNHRLLDSLASDIGASHLRIESDAARDGCAAGNVGEYTWSTSPGGRILYIEPLSDACSDRMAGLSGTWVKMDCPVANDFCLGDLEAGDYDSQFFDPFVGPGETWVPRFGVVRYTVPEGWANASDWPTSYQLQAAAVQATSINLYANVAVVSDDHCTETPDPTVGRSAQAIADWLDAAPGLVTTAPAAAAIGGLTGFRIDIALDPEWTETCPFSDGAPVRGVFADGTGFHWTIGPGTRSRLFVLDLGDGRAVLVDIEARSDAADDAFVAEATSVVESFAFEP
jgi:hypothetical protein